MVKISGAYGKLKTWVKAQLHTNHQVASAESASFKEVDIAVNEAYKQNSKDILKFGPGSQNLMIGDNIGASNTGPYNVFIGSYAGYSNTSGHRNMFLGSYAGYLNTTGQRNLFIGCDAGIASTSGNYNTFIGAYVAKKNNIGYQNTFIGSFAGEENTNGYNNVYIGGWAGQRGISSYGNTFIGFAAGCYETGNNKLFIDNQNRGSEANGRIKALIYGIFDVAIANQLIRLNAILELTSIKNGSTQANAGAAINEVWKTNGHATLPDNVLMLGV